MKRKGWIILIVSVLALLIILFGLVIFYFFYYAPPVPTSSGGAVFVQVRNPIAGLNDSEALAQFNVMYIRYLLAIVNATRLHNPPLSSNIPKINFYIEDQTYHATVDKGLVGVASGEIANGDISIHTTRAEIIKMLKDPTNIPLSFSNGGSSVDMVAGKLSLALKGYVQLYESLTGKKLL